MTLLVVVGFTEEDPFVKTNDDVVGRQSDNSGSGVSKFVVRRALGRHGGLTYEVQYGESVQSILCTSQKDLRSSAFSIDSRWGSCREGRRVCRLA